MAQANQADIDLYRAMQKSPILFIQKIWSLTPERDNSKFELGKHITRQQHDILLGVERALSGESFTRLSIRSGHGIGKTAVSSWLLLWYLFCFKDAQIACTSPTRQQMFDVLWKEVKRWIDKMPPEIAIKYQWTASHVRIDESPETWFAKAGTGNKENPEALAGVHGDNVMILVDEASGVPDEVYKVMEGALTGKGILLIMFSNPTRTSGYFYESHNIDRGDWQNFRFSSENSPIVEKDYVDRMSRKWGKDSDEYKVRVKGEFPDVDAMDKSGYVPLLKESDLSYSYAAPFTGIKKLGVDPAGAGKDETVWILRDRFKAQVYHREKISKAKGIAQKTITIMAAEGIKQEHVTVDMFGEGAETVVELAAAGKRVKGVNVGNIPDKTLDKENYDRFVNLRAKAYWRMRQWLKQGGQLIRHEKWKELLSIRYRHELSGKIKIKPKKAMKADGDNKGMSPDAPDGIMLTFLEEDTDMSKQNYKNTKVMYDRLGRPIGTTVRSSSPFDGAKIINK